MTELEALRRVAEAARVLATRNLGRVVLGWQELDAALRALDALPAPAAEPEAVEVGVWRGSRGGIALAAVGTPDDTPMANWTRLGTTRLALVPEVNAAVEQR